MRPYIDRCQDLPNGIDWYLPKSASGIAVTAQVMKWMQRRPFRAFAEKKWFRVADAVDLPDHRNLCGKPYSNRRVMRWVRTSARLVACIMQRLTLRRHQLRLGDAVDPIQSGLVDTDVLTDHFGCGTGIAEPQRQ